MTLISIVVLKLLIYTNIVQSVLYDLSNGDYDVLDYPCSKGPSGSWAFELVSLYPGGPQGGTVLSSAKNLSACLATLDLVPVSSESVFYIQVHVPYAASEDSMQVWIAGAEGGDPREWFSVSGPVTPGEEWLEFGVPAPGDVKTDAYKIEIWDNSATVGISIRYFEITDEARTTIPATTEREGTTVVATSTPPVSDTTVQISPTSDTSRETSSVGTQAPSVTPSAGSTLTWTSTIPPPPPPGGFVLSGWSVVVGVAIGVLLMTSLFCLGTCCWWVVCVKWRRDAEPQQDLTLPRLEVVSS